MIYIEARTTWLPSGAGGRARPVAPLGGRYRPHVRVDSIAELLGVSFLAGPALIYPGDTVTVHMRCLYHPAIDYSDLDEGVQFSIVEGPRVVAIGEVLKVYVGPGR
jgi:translation elongation factor EF-Tu-like GTPase